MADSSVGRTENLNTRPYIKVNSLTGDKSLDTLISEIEALLKPYNHSMNVRIEKTGNVIGIIGIDATIRNIR